MLLSGVVTNGNQIEFCMAVNTYIPSSLVYQEPIKHFRWQAKALDLRCLIGYNLLCHWDLIECKIHCLKLTNGLWNQIAGFMYEIAFFKGYFDRNF